jgi:hypothetical protein
MSDRFASSIATSLLTPITNAVAVTPSDTEDLPFTTRQLFIGTAGNLKVTLLSGAVVTYSNVPVGDFVRRVTRVWSTGTTASNIVAED